MIASVALAAGFFAGRHGSSLAAPADRPPTRSLPLGPAGKAPAEARPPVAITGVVLAAPSAAAATDAPAWYAALTTREGNNLICAMDLCGRLSTLPTESLVALIEQAAALETQPGRRDTLQTLALLRLAQRDAPRASAELLRLAQREESTATVRDSVLTYLAETDPAQAVQTALAYAHVTGKYHPTFAALLPELSKTDPAVVGDLAQMLATSADPEERELSVHCAQNLASRLCQQGQRDEALRWLASAPPDQRAAGLQTTIQRLAQTHDLEGAILAYHTLSAEPDEDTATALADALEEAPPATAQSFASSLPPGNLRATCLEKLVPPQLAEQGAAATFAWLRTLPAGADLNTAYVAVADAFVKTDLAQALTCVEALAVDDSIKEVHRVHYGFRWLQADRATASRALPAEMTAFFDHFAAVQQEASQLFPGLDCPISIAPQPAKPTTDQPASP